MLPNSFVLLSWPLRPLFHFFIGHFQTSITIFFNNIKTKNVHPGSGTDISSSQPA